MGRLEPPLGLGILRATWQVTVFTCGEVRDEKAKERMRARDREPGAGVPCGVLNAALLVTTWGRAPILPLSLSLTQPVFRQATARLALDSELHSCGISPGGGSGLNRRNL